MAGSFKVLGGMLNDRPFLIWEVLKNDIDTRWPDNWIKNI